MMGHVNLHDWIDELCDVLDIDTEVDEGLVLDLAKVVADNVVRKAAPISTYLLGYAAGLQEADPVGVEKLAARAQALAEGWDRPVHGARPGRHRRRGARRQHGRPHRRPVRGLMRAVVASGPGGPEVLALGEVPDQDPGPGEVAITVAATAVNRADLLQRQGHYPPPPGASGRARPRVQRHCRRPR